MSILGLGINVFGASVEFPLRYDETLVNQGFASPVISVQINGDQGIFLIDSGASITVVSRWFSDRANIRLGKIGSVGGSSGGNGTSAAAIVNMFIKNSKGAKEIFKKKSVVIVDLPDVFQRNSIAGIISPQQLLKDGQFGTLSLSESPFFRISGQQPRKEDRFFPLNTIFSEGPGGQQNVLFTLDAIVDEVKTSFIVDTGADGASIGAETESGKKLLAKSIPTDEKIGGITGKPEVIRIVPQAQVKILDHDIKMKIRLQPISKQMSADGMLGMQFLKNCSLIISLKTGSISCP
ncbi:MAG: hypothetical protein A2622_00010 [Bdellovibrionales bacterium RIFCSPHIGHO2_01_FULL_40_29]|nr:MAG: hypothetical protein A2622_00010 [Bdellovibrionales bacterium RIFCSPHIGHO2_01_FULL_40_29]OFZ32511.1 MAG: hypothetical protein A3D17_04610 [Bdellovibrionales bacterium RIFCSPHIGHO2_02_FULL_40_15]